MKPVEQSRMLFLLVDIGDFGRQSDDSVFHNDNLEYAIENNLLNIPQSSKLSNSDSVMPYVFIRMMYLE